MPVRNIYNVRGTLELPTLRSASPAEQSYNICTAEKPDYKDVRALINDIWRGSDHASIVSEIRRWCSHLVEKPGDVFLFAVDRRGAPVGYVVFDAPKSAGSTCLSYENGVSKEMPVVDATLGVGSEHRGNGIGSMLIREACRIARGKGIKVVLARIKPDNAPSIAAAKSLGFAPVRYNPEDGLLRFYLLL